ncbi:AbgT family transporter [Streptomyces sp. NPDC050428]|uniref:AbgT family transporter n=1 Tax=Streptomyces sp. NPDC050428 TaxID=3155757 RepID=UPI00341A0368
MSTIVSSTPSAPPTPPTRPSRALRLVERAGNMLPHPFWLFGVLAVVLALASWLLASLGTTTTLPDGSVKAVRSLVSADGVQLIFGGVIDNFIAFPPLGTALVALLGVGLAEQAGLLRVGLRAAVSRVSPRWITFLLAFIGSAAHIAGDAGYIVLIPLGGLIFKSVGRSPILGIVVALVALSGGSAASPLLIPNDVIFAGLATAAAQTVDPQYVVTPTANIYFTLASSLLLSIVITLVVEFYLRRRMDLSVDADNKSKSRDSVKAGESDDSVSLTITDAERRGLRNAGLASAGYLFALVLAVLPHGSPLRGKGGALLDSTLLSSIAPLLALFFAVAGLAYGVTAGTIRNSADVPRLIGEGLKDMTPVIVLFFAVSQFLAYFKWTGIGELIAVNGAQALRDLNAPTPLIFMALLLLVSAMNFFITSGSAQLSLVGPIFIPMLMMLNIPPETTLALYRIADSCTNILTPVSPYFVLALGLIQNYRRSAGIGTLFSMTLPLSVAMFLAWSGLFFAWWALGVPLGPGAAVR